MQAAGCLSLQCAVHNNGAASFRRSYRYPRVALKNSRAVPGLFPDLQSIRGGAAHTRPLWRLARQATHWQEDLRGSGEGLIDAGFVPKGQLLSTKLPSDVRRRAEDAIARKGFRVTVGDVAAVAGLTLRQAEEALKALAADSLATLQVSNEGEILYVFDPSFRAAMRARSLLLRLEPVGAAVVQGAAYLARVAFGTALIVSVVTVYVAMIVLLSSSQDDNKERRRGERAFDGGPRIWFNLSDVLWYWDPWYYRHRRERMAAVRRGEGSMGFLESIFSFVFGDGDPNTDFDKRRWRAIGRYIQHRGGVVAAEELAPFLDVVPGQVGSDRGQITVNESYMLPALARLGGEPQVDAAGNLLYTFPSLQQTGGISANTLTPPAPTLEQPWKLTEASPGQKLGVVGLGVANLVGVLVLSGMLNSPSNVYTLMRNDMGWVLGMLPLLQAYAFSFFLIPVWRWLRNRTRNVAIDVRNDARRQAASLVKRPDATLAAKLRSAAKQAQQHVLSERDAVYRTDRDTYRQPRDVEGDLFEERLAWRERERAQQRAQQQAQRGKRRH